MQQINSNIILIGLIKKYQVPYGIVSMFVSTYRCVKTDLWKLTDVWIIGDMHSELNCCFF